MGRGQYQRWNTRISTADLYPLRLADFKKRDCFEPGHSYSWWWTRDGEKVASISFTVAYSYIQFMYDVKNGDDSRINVDRIISLVSTPCYFGGHRKWFLCGCGRKVATMYIHGQKIACRNCFNAVYPSQREAVIDRKWRKIYKLEAKLKDGRYKPKGMHWKTFSQIKNECIKVHIMKDRLLELEISHRFPRMEF